VDRYRLTDPHRDAAILALRLACDLEAERAAMSWHRAEWEAFAAKVAGSPVTWCVLAFAAGYAVRWLAG
jgi:hypothetical protein